MRHARTRIGGRGEGMLSDGLELFHKWSYSIAGRRDETLSNSWPLQIEFLPSSTFPYSLAAFRDSGKIRTHISLQGQWKEWWPLLALYSYSLIEWANPRVLGDLLDHQLYVGGWIGDKCGGGGWFVIFYFPLVWRWVFGYSVSFKWIPVSFISTLCLFSSWDKWSEDKLIVWEALYFGEFLSYQISCYYHNVIYSQSRRKIDSVRNPFPVNLRHYNVTSVGGSWHLGVSFFFYQD